MLDEVSIIAPLLFSSFHDSLAANFVRVHRSFIVNADKVSAYSKHAVEIGEITVPIGESYKATVDGYYKKAAEK